VFDPLSEGVLVKKQLKEVRALGVHVSWRGGKFVVVGVLRPFPRITGAWFSIRREVGACFGDMPWGEHICEEVADDLCDAFRVSAYVGPISGTVVESSPWGNLREGCPWVIIVRGVRENDSMGFLRLLSKPRLEVGASRLSLASGALGFHVGHSLNEYCEFGMGELTGCGHGGERRGNIIGVRGGMKNTWASS
jgi:hypothetical protein